MRPYNTYRNPELSQPVSSVENTLAEKTQNANAPYDILRSLSESISVDCGSFELLTPTERYQSSSISSHVDFVDQNGREFRTPVESVSSTPVKREPAKAASAPAKSSVNAAADMDDDNYDCMNDPNYRAQSQNNVSAPSFEELMARTAESIAKMREETQAADSSKTLSSQSKGAAEPSQPQKQEEKPSIDSRSESSTKKGFLFSTSWNKIRKALFSRETIKLVLLSVAVGALIVSAVIYRNSPHRNNGLSESDDVILEQPADSSQYVSVQGNETTDKNELNASDSGDYWGSSDDGWSDPAVSNRQAMTDSFQDDYKSPSFDANPLGYSQNESNDYPIPEDAGRQLAPPHNSNNGNQFVETIPVYNSDPQYADVSPAIGAQYSPDDYESPILEDDTVSGYSETGYNSNFMR